MRNLILLLKSLDDGDKNMSLLGDILGDDLVKGIADHGKSVLDAGLQRKNYAFMASTQAKYEAASRKYFEKNEGQQSKQKINKASNSSSLPDWVKYGGIALGLGVFSLIILKVK